MSNPIRPGTSPAETLLTKHLLIDSKNMLYRAIYTAAQDKRYGKDGYHVINVVLHFMTWYLAKFKPEQIHLFWDSPRSQAWRKSIYPDYKEGRVPRDGIDIGPTLNSLSIICIELLRNAGCRHYYKPEMEADDLIYAFCEAFPYESIIIASSDSDLKQISFKHDNVRIHNPLIKERWLEEKPQLSPIIMKSLIGDKSDNIDGYYGIGKVKAARLVEDLTKLDEFLNSDKAVILENGVKRVVHQQKYHDNLKLIDLAQCPALAENVDYIKSRRDLAVKFDLDEIRNIIIKHKLNGVMTDLSRYVMPLKRLVESGHG